MSKCDRGGYGYEIRIQALWIEEGCLIEPHENSRALFAIPERGSQWSIALKTNLVGCQTAEREVARLNPG